MFECEAKTLNKRRSFHFSPHQIKFSSSWICSRLLFLLLLFFNKKRLNERFVYQLSQPIPSPPPASLPLLAFPRCVTFECHGWRTETDVCSAARLSISLCLHDCDSHRLLPTSRKTSRLFILPLLLLLRLIGTAVRAVEGSACKAAALARAAR